MLRRYAQGQIADIEPFVVGTRVTARPLA